MRNFRYLALFILLLSCSSKETPSKKERLRPLFRDQCSKNSGVIDNGACYCPSVGTFFNPYKQTCK